MNWSFSFLLLVSIALAGCAKDDSPLFGPKHREPDRRDLHGLSFEQVLSDKYEKFALVCQLWSQRQTQLDLSVSPNAEVVVDLKAPVQHSGIFEMSAEIPNHKTTVRFTIDGKGIVDEVQRTKKDGSVDVFLYSPRLTVRIESTSITEFESGPFIAEHKGSAQTIFEGERLYIDQTQLIADGQRLKAGDETKGDLLDYADCRFESVLKPEYADHFRTQKK